MKATYINNKIEAQLQKLPENIFVPPFVKVELEKHLKTSRLTKNTAKTVNQITWEWLTSQQG